MIKKYKLMTMVALVALALLLGNASEWVKASPPVQTGENLLANPGFEGLTCRPGSPPGQCLDNWTRDTFTGAPYNEIYTPQGWTTYWSEGVNPSDRSHSFGRPECKVIPNAAPFLGPPARVRSGYYAIMQFGFFRAIDSGVYQRVTGLTPHSRVAASAYAHTWTCDDDDHGAYSCDDGYNMLFRVGIDPNGGTDPWSPSVVWTSGYSTDQYRLIGPTEVEVGDAGAVTVFLRATAKWPFKHNDVYWDDASLVYTTPPVPPTDTPPPPPPTYSGPPPTPRPTSTPRPDGAIVHRVQSGETLYGIAAAYGVTADQIIQLNAGSIPSNLWLTTGQDLVISIPSAPPTEALPTPEPGSTEAAPTEAPPTPESGSICVLAYHDRNGDTFRQQDTEEALPNAIFSLGDAAGLRGQYETDGLSEPYCFTGLQPGSYRVTMQSPTGYVASGPGDMAVALAGPGRLDVALGASRSDSGAVESTTVPDETTDPEGGSETPSEGGGFSWRTVLLWGSRIGGVVMLALALVLAVYYFLGSRRRW